MPSHRADVSARSGHAGRSRGLGLPSRGGAEQAECGGAQKSSEKLREAHECFRVEQTRPGEHAFGRGAAGLGGRGATQPGAGVSQSRASRSFRASSAPTRPGTCSRSWTTRRACRSWTRIGPIGPIGPSELHPEPGHLHLHECGGGEVLRGLASRLAPRASRLAPCAGQATPPTRVITTLQSDGRGGKETFGARGSVSTVRSSEGLGLPRASEGFRGLRLRKASEGSPRKLKAEEWIIDRGEMDPLKVRRLMKEGRCSGPVIYT